MPPKELLDFHADLINLLIRRSRYRMRPVVPQSSSHYRDGIPSGYSLSHVGKVGILRGKCHHCLHVLFITPHLPALFVDFFSARFPVLLTITRTEFYVVTC